MITNVSESGNKVFESVLRKAYDDDNYRAELVASPREAIKSATGFDVPEGSKIVVVDQTDPATAHLAIPPKPRFDDMELTDEQLEAVAGGGEIWFVTCLVTVLVVGACVGASQN